MASERARYRAEVPVKPERPEPPSPENHSHKQPRDQIIRRNITEALLGLVAVASLLLTYQVYVLQQGQNETTAYIEGRGTQRDAENERLNERIDAAVCDVLDQLPAGGLFDPIRAQYGCGPGIPVDQLDPQAAQNLADILGSVNTAQPAQTASAPTTATEPTSAPDEMPPGAPPDARPSPMGTPPATTSAPETTSPAPTTAAPTTPPLVDLSTVTDPVCDLLRICI